MLFLHNNLLHVFPVWKLSILPPNLSIISVANNPWTCDCSFVQQLQQFLSRLTVMDTSQLDCVGQESTVNIENNITCVDSLAVPVSQTVSTDHQHSLVIITVTICGVFLVIVTSSCLVFVFRTSLTLWLHSRHGIRIAREKGSSSKDSFYDAFITYSVGDEQFLQQTFLPALDTAHSSYRLCLQHRDLSPGVCTMETWPAVYQACARVVMLVSRAFLAKECQQVELCPILL